MKWFSASWSYIHCPSLWSCMAQTALSSFVIYCLVESFQISSSFFAELNSFSEFIWPALMAVRRPWFGPRSHYWWSLHDVGYPLPCLVPILMHGYCCLYLDAQNWVDGFPLRFLLHCLWSSYGFTFSMSYLGPWQCSPTIPSISYTTIAPNIFGTCFAPATCVSQCPSSTHALVKLNPPFVCFDASRGVLSVFLLPFPSISTAPVSFPASEACSTVVTDVVSIIAVITFVRLRPPDRRISAKVSVQSPPWESSVLRSCLRIRTKT